MFTAPPTVSPSAPVEPEPEAARGPRWLLWPPLLWMGAFFVLPVLIMVAVSLASRGTYGGIVWTWTLDNYRTVADPLFLNVFVRSLVLAGLTTVACLAAGFPVAYYIARLPPRRQAVWLLLLMIPFWTNFLVRTYAWTFLLRAEGVFNTALMALGVVDEPLELLYTDGAVLLGLVYGYLPFMVLPLYAAIERVPPSLVEAARDLYATRWDAFRLILWPLTKPGVLAGCLLVFIPSLGAFITPDLLGGARSMMVGNLIQHEYLVARDWPLGSALALALMALVGGAAVLLLRGDARSGEGWRA